MKKLLGIGIFLAILMGGFYILLEIEGNLTDPTKIFYQWSGWIAYGALVGGLVLPFGKWWGLFALLMGLLHSSVFVFFDFYFDWGLMLAEIIKKPYIYAGVFGLILMIILGIFSLGKKFYSILRYGVYGAVIGSLVHIVMIAKVLSWQIWGVILVSVGILGIKMKFIPFYLLTPTKKRVTNQNKSMKKKFSPKEHDF
ncbi:hypothetical protein CQA62_01365 [Helicobacter cholecystus]|uniref:Ferric oxidoreductase domain-containing protein n=1 Tax=Helicobacter cholecystus TaxID=45498 RepID=A0A3D8IYQ8_9HELI|nr:ferric reductase-like transmembrane domain-containing protein [Helicobacter cholecystus]RDU70090.1 hypothetical protein CQA62_01365 [Helicobacter cholecystus]VEJ24733.1 putative sulfite oxidase subunit YedZ [Helicobacter cholecystus]